MSVREIDQRAKWSAAHLKEVHRSLTATSDLLRGLARNELADKLLAERDSLGQDLHVRIVLAGDFNSGKSALINALIGTTLASPHPLATTPIPIEVRWGPELRCKLVSANGESTGVSLDLLKEITTDPGLVRNTDYIVVETPSDFLAAGISIVDTTSLSGGLASPEAAQVLGFIHSAQAVILVSDAGRELTAPQAEFLQVASALGDPLVLSVLTKTDLYPHWERIRDVNQERLRELGAAGPVLGSSSTLYSEACLFGDEEALAESGIERLRWYLSATLFADLLQHQSATALDGAAILLDEAKVSFELELKAASSSHDAADLAAELADRTRKLDRLASGIQSQVQHQLGLFSTAISSNLERRLRELQESTEQIIDKGDPTRSWPSMQSQIFEGGNRIAAEHYAFVDAQRIELVKNLADFAGMEAMRLGLNNEPAIPNSIESADVGDLLDIAPSRISRFDIVRGSMGGLLTTTGTIGTVTSLASSVVGAGAIVAAAPFVVPVGLAGAIYTFKTMLDRRNQVDLEASKASAKKETAQYLRTLGQNLKEDTNRSQLEVKTWLTSSLNEQIPALKRELTEETERLSALAAKSQSELNESLEGHRDILDSVEAHRASVRRLALTMRRPEMSEVYR